LAGRIESRYRDAPEAWQSRSHGSSNPAKSPWWPRLAGANHATYAAKITAGDRRLDLDAPARELVDRVRGLSPHIGARAELQRRGVTIWRARVADDGSFEPLEVQPDGGRRMTYEAWLRGLRP
jgi:hypothetical protein